MIYRHSSNINFSQKHKIQQKINIKSLKKTQNLLKNPVSNLNIEICFWPVSALYMKTLVAGVAFF